MVLFKKGYNYLTKLNRLLSVDIPLIVRHCFEKKSSRHKDDRFSAYTISEARLEKIPDEMIKQRR